jgi:hypothetical protein
VVKEAVRPVDVLHLAHSQGRALDARWRIAELSTCVCHRGYGEVLSWAMDSDSMVFVRRAVRCRRSNEGAVAKRGAVPMIGIDARVTAPPTRYSTNINCVTFLAWNY